MKVPALPLAIAPIAIALITTSLTAKPGLVVAATTKQSNPIVVKATVKNSQVGCKLLSPGTSTTYYQKGQVVTVTPSFPSFTVAADGTLTGNPSLALVEFQCSPGITVTGTLTSTNAQVQGNLATVDTFLGSSSASPSLDCTALAKQNATASGSAPTTGNATPSVYLWYGACAQNKNNWAAGTYAIVDPVTVTFT